MKSGLEMAAQERADQTETGMDSEDDKYINGELAYAGMAYAIRGRSLLRQAIPMFWPWGTDKWNPTPHDHRIELAKAAALFMAEIDRLNRLERKTNGNAKILESAKQ